MVSGVNLWQRYRLPVAAAALALLLTAVAYSAAAELADRQARERFEFRAQQVHEAIARRLESYVHVLRAAGGLFDATEHVTRDMWRTYVDRLALPQIFPGFQGLGYSTRIPAERLARHEQLVRDQGFLEYRVHPAHPRPEYHSIVYLEPFDWRNQRAFGYDMFTEVTRRAAMERARDAGGPAMSGRVKLIQETEDDVQAGFLIYHPVYRPGAPIETMEQRRDALLGFVYSPMRVDNLLRGVLGGAPIGIDFMVYDGDAAAERLMYATREPGDASSPRFTSTRRLAVAGHEWTLHFASTPGFEDVVDRWRPGLILVVGLVISVLLFMAVRAALARLESALALLETRR
jgi:CHASE1-domain containing sensor protein